MSHHIPVRGIRFSHVPGSMRYLETTLAQMMEPDYIYGWQAAELRRCEVAHAVVSRVVPAGVPAGVRVSSSPAQVEASR